MLKPSRDKNVRDVPLWGGGRRGCYVTTDPGSELRLYRRELYKKGKDIADLWYRISLTGSVVDARSTIENDHRSTVLRDIFTVWSLI